MSGRWIKLLSAVMASAVVTACGGGGTAASDRSPVSTLYAFNKQSGNYQPMALVVANSQGDLYGAAAQAGYGSIFELDTNGNLKTLHQFDGTDGTEPTTLVMAADGSLYGTTNGGGTYGWGTVFKISSAGSRWEQTTTSSSRYSQGCCWQELMHCCGVVDPRRPLLRETERYVSAD